MDHTRDSIATLIARCESDDYQLDICGDIYLQMWPLGDCHLEVDWTVDEVRYIGESWTFGEVVQFYREHNCRPCGN
jgi:hypothetical protein